MATGENPQKGRRKSSAGGENAPRRRSTKSRGVSIVELEERRGSLPLPQLKQEEEIFFELIQAGNVAEVERFLTDHRGVNLNCINFKGLNALQIAIINTNEDMVKMLLRRPDIDIKDAALHAVDSGNTAITLLVLDYLHSTLPGSEFGGCNDSAEYAPDVTPLSLAATNGDVEMVRLLLDRNHHMEMPHASNCLCRTCKAFIQEHGSTLSTIRLNAYKGICNPAYIFQVTDDPIYYAFVLDKELKECAEMDKEFAGSEEADARTILKGKENHVTDATMRMRSHGKFTRPKKRKPSPLLWIWMYETQMHGPSQSKITSVPAALKILNLSAWTR